MIIPIKIKGKAREILRRPNVQIYTLDSIEPHTRNRFLFGKSKAILILDKHTIKGRLQDLGSGIISIEADEEIPIYVKKGDIVLVVLPESPERRYILQSKVKNRFLHTVHLEILDPRADKRFKLYDRSIHVELRPLSHAMLQGIISEKILIVREINFGIDESMSEHSTPEPPLSPPIPMKKPPGDQNPRTSSGFTYNAKDSCLDVNTKKIHPEFLDLIRKGAFTDAQLWDISKGGLGLFCGKSDANITPGSVHLASGVIPLSHDKSFTFSLIGIVRGTNRLDQGIRIHIMFIKPLPKRFEDIMTVELTNP